MALLCMVACQMKAASPVQPIRRNSMRLTLPAVLSAFLRILIFVRRCIELPAQASLHLRQPVGKLDHHSAIDRDRLSGDDRGCIRRAVYGDIRYVYIVRSTDREKVW